MTERYKLIAEDIKCAIEDGKYRDKFPGYRELATQYGTSLRTITRVMDKLKAEKLIITTPGRHSKVIAPVAKEEV